MRKLLFKFLCIVFVVLLSATSMTFVASSYDIYTYNNYAGCNNVLLLNDDNSIYLVGTNNNEVRIDRVYPDTYNVTLTLSSKVHSYNLFDDTLIMLCPDKSINQTKIELYDIYTDTFTSFNVNYFLTNESTQIAYSNGYVYLTNGSDVLKYSQKGKLIQKYTFGINTCYLMQDNNSNVYCIAYDGVYIISNNSYEKVLNTDFHTAARFVSDTVFVTAFGYTYNFADIVINQKSTVDYPSGGIYKKRCIIASGNQIYAVNTTDNNVKKYITLKSDVAQLYVVGSDIVALTYDNGTPMISIISYSQLVDMPVDNLSDDNNSNLENKLNGISSDVYTIDNERMVISSIDPSTTIGVFKKNINYDGYNVEFIRYGGKVITSGTVGTATLARFYNDSYVYEYELCVSGDITGEGNVNSRDKVAMFDYLLGEITFNGVFIDASNLYESDYIDTKDMILLLRMIENG